MTTNTQRFQDIGAYRIKDKTPIRGGYGHILECRKVDGEDTILVYTDAKPKTPQLGDVYNLAVATHSTFCHSGRQVPVLGRFSPPSVS